MAGCLGFIITIVAMGRVLKIGYLSYLVMGTAEQSVGRKGIMRHWQGLRLYWNSIHCDEVHCKIQDAWNLHTARCLTDYREGQHC